MVARVLKAATAPLPKKKTKGNLFFTIKAK
jgi:hypothetical protein